MAAALNRSAVGINRTTLAVLKVREIRDLCGKWPATRREIADAKCACTPPLPRGIVKPSERIAQRQHRAALRRDRDLAEVRRFARSETTLWSLERDEPLVMPARAAGAGAASELLNFRVGDP